MLPNGLASLEKLRKLPTGTVAQMLAFANLQRVPNDLDPAAQDSGSVNAALRKVVAGAKRSSLERMGGKKKRCVRTLSAPISLSGGGPQ
jgi:hypothetical protein